MPNNFYRRLRAWARGGTREFNEAESILLSAVVKRLPTSEALILSEQIRSVSLVQRQHPGRLVVAYYNRSTTIPELPYPGYEHCLANVTYTTRSGTRKAMSVVLHNARLMTLERNVPQNANEVKDVLSVKLHPRGYKSEANVIDEEEHDDFA
jgi:hypothetical protein